MPSFEGFENNFELITIYIIAEVYNFRPTLLLYFIFYDIFFIYLFFQLNNKYF